MFRIVMSGHMNILPKLPILINQVLAITSFYNIIEIDVFSLMHFSADQEQYGQWTIINTCNFGLITRFS